MTRGFRTAALALLAAAAVAGCAAPEHRSDVEFDRYTEVWQLGRLLGDVCGVRDNELSVKAALMLVTERLALWGRFSGAKDSETYGAQIYKLAAEFEPGGSKAYCVGTSINIRTAAERVLGQVGRREP